METRLVDREDLEAFVGIPAGANHAGGQAARVGVNDLAHDCRCGCDRREATELVGLNVRVQSHLLGDHLSVRGRS